LRGFTFDAGALIALERRTAFMLGILAEGLAGTVEVVIPRTVIAQVWRGTARQANINPLIKTGRGRAAPVSIDELTDERAKEIGIRIGETSHPGIVDVHVAVVAGERGHAVVTSDDDDIARVDPDLVIVHV
jgi:predicted nucleic acid-binding protein